ncbi:hypothetical protein DXB51_03880 [Bacillus cereus]|nr:hypothetical protein DXB51_03880 [Bacillus cereus]
MVTSIHISPSYVFENERVVPAHSHLYPALTGSKIPTSKLSENKAVRRGTTAHKSPIGVG